MAVEHQYDPCHRILPALEGYRLRKLLAAFGSPGHRAATGRPFSLGLQRTGEAFCELINSFPTDQAPHSGGVSASVVVEMDLGDLTTRLSEPGIIPAVLGGRSHVLDLGRRRRLHSEAQRVVIFRRDTTCRAEGCDWPAHMSHVHHTTPWSRGGPTTITNAMTLCPRHHSRAHDPTYQMTVSKHGTVVFRRT